MRRRTLLALLALAAAAPLRADVILTAEALNASLKSMQRQQRRLPGAAPEAQAAAVFELGVEADALAALLSDEVAAHGMQERQLLELALRRTADIGVSIQWMIAKDRFFYDGDAFRRYLELAPQGPRAPESAFWLVETEFYQSTGDDAEAILAASAHKREFLERYPGFQLAADVGVFLAIDYRDLYRLHRDAGRAGRAADFERRARQQFARVAERFPETDSGRVAAEMLERLAAEAEAVPGPRAAEQGGDRPPGPPR